LHRRGQVTGETKFWAQGMDGWRKPHENAQLKWTLMIKDAGILNESEVATNCLNMLIRMCEMYPSRHRDGAIIRPLPKIKRYAPCKPSPGVAAMARERGQARKGKGASARERAQARERKKKRASGSGQARERKKKRARGRGREEEGERG